MLPYLLPLLQEAEQHGPASPFEPEFGLIFWTWLVFIGLFFVLKKYAWPAILTATEERERKIAHQLDEAEKMNAEAKAVLEEHKALLAGARDEASKLIGEAKTVAELRREAVDLSLAAASRLVEANLDDAANRKLVEEYLRSLEPSP